MEKLFLNTQRLIIRNLKESDLEDFYTYRSDPEVAKYQGFDVMTKEQADFFIAAQKDKLFGHPGVFVQYAIENKQTKRLLGDCAIRLNEFSEEIAEIGITISPLEQQRGYAKETMLGILSFLFDIKKIHRIEETVDVENIASIKLLESIGFRKEGHFIENIFFKGKWGSECRYAMLKREWDEINDAF